MTKLLSLFLILVFLIGVFAYAPFDVGAVTTHISKDGLYEYRVLDGKYAELTYFMPKNLRPLNETEYNEDGSYTIPSTVDGFEVRYIGNRCFMDHTIPAKKVMIPDTVTYIGWRAFSFDENTSWYGNDCIKEIAIPSSVTYIDEGAFCENPNLQKVSLSSGLTHIGSGAFRESGITEITVPETVKEIGCNCFASCVNLKTAKIKARIYAIEEYMFEYCKKLSSLELSDTVNSIKEKAFYGCDSLKSFKFYFSYSNPGFGSKAIGYTNDAKTGKEKK